MTSPSFGHRRALYALAWSATTICGAAVCLLGIRSAIDITSPDQPFQPLPVTVSSPAVSPTPSVSPTVTPSPVRTVVRSTAPSRSMRRTPPAADVRTYRLRGGTVTLLTGSASARVTRARPSPGCSVQNWSGAGWLRVDFGCGRHHGSAFFVTWNGTPPQVQSYNF